MKVAIENLKEMGYV